MKLSDWASIAEIVAAVGIIISLLFVGFEVRDGNLETRAATTQAALDAEMAFQTQLVEYADVWQHVIISGEPTDEATIRRAIALFNMLMTVNDNRFQMMNSGYLDFQETGLRAVLGLPFYELWRESPGALGRSAAFLNFIDQMREEEINR